MKKPISVLIVLVLILSLCATVACSKKETPKSPDAETPATASEEPVSKPEPDTPQPAEPEKPEIDLEKTKPNEYVFEKIEAGMTPYIGISFLNIGDEFQKMYTDGLLADMKALGFDGSIVDGRGDAIVQLEQIENFVTMKAAAIVIRVGDVDMYEDVYKRCQEQGTYMAMFAAIPTTWHPDLTAPVDQVEQGTQVVNMTRHWLDLRYPDAEPESLHAAVFGRMDNTENVTRYETMKEKLQEDPRVKLTFTIDSCLTLEEGFNGAQQALSYDPDIRIFLANSGTSLVGVNNYVFTQPQYDPSEFCCFGTGKDNTAMEMIEASKTDESIFRGIIATGYDTLWGAVYRGLVALFKGEVKAPYTYWERQYAIASFDYYYDSDDSKA
ncbi:MAG: substrate-binding domain-containing protein [Oscillospiraceae bacterium]|jgi:ABC-type sugar transport system substrate-binding protein